MWEPAFWNRGASDISQKHNQKFVPECSVLLRYPVHEKISLRNMIPKADWYVLTTNPYTANRAFDRVPQYRYGFYDSLVSQ